MSDLLIFQYYQTVTPNALLVRNTVNNLYKLLLHIELTFIYPPSSLIYFQNLKRKVTMTIDEK